VRHDIAEALTVEAELDEASSMYWGQYFRYLVEAHRFDPKGAAAYLLGPLDFAVAFETELRPRLRTSIGAAAVGEDAVGPSAAAIEEGWETFAVAAEQAALRCRQEWQAAAARAEAALDRVREEASRKLELVRRAVEPPAEFEKGMIVFGAGPSGPGEFIPADPAPTRRALDAAFFAVARDATPSPTLASQQGSFVARLRRRIRVILSESLVAARRAYSGGYLEFYRDSERRQIDWLECKTKLLEGKRMTYAEVPFVVRDGKLWQEMARGSVRMFMDKTGQVLIKRSLPAMFGQWTSTGPKRAGAASRPDLAGG
jgi:hypothetical protein